MSSRLTVAVLMGGPSEEHEISLRSGRGVVEALERLGWSVAPLVIPRTLAPDAVREAARAALTQRDPDVVFIALHGAFGEDGTIQELCDELDLAYIGSDAASSRLGIDKLASKRRFQDAGLVVPRWQLVACREGRGLSSIQGLAYPVVVKPTRQGSSIGVSIVRRPEALEDAVAEAARYGAFALLEEWIEGREMTVGVLGEAALPVVEIRPRHAFFDYTAKYTPGQTDYVVPAPLCPGLTRTVQDVGLAAHRALGCRHLSRADVILRPDGVPMLLEVNTIPGFTPTSLLPKAAACLGLSYEALCERLVMMAWQGHLAHVETSP